MNCEGKVRYSEAEAWRHAKKFRKTGDPCHAYHCRRCGAWHIGRDRKMTREYAGGMEE